MQLLSRQTKRKDIWNIACPQQICCWRRRKRPFIWRLQGHFVQDKSWLSGAHSPLLFVYHPAHANQFPRTGIIKWNTAVFTSVSSFYPPAMLLCTSPTLHNRIRWGVSSCQTFVCELQMHHSVSHIHTVTRCVRAVALTRMTSPSGIWSIKTVPRIDTEWGRILALAAWFPCTIR